ncbi:hypothetical protein [Pedobacter insulae]|uniref:Lipoprotein n=1 Tax=Pedobacter insulae TaxID=414048 RepID=A0A1I2TJR1_9SPHI|nr:hypothetical protein [Pedobacter insulae]SFG64359.1 hypothetical protein SAMN04489864_101419 [Pedobacter insulae]
MEKKYLVLIIGILLSAFGIYSCNYPPTKKENDTDTTHGETLKGGRHDTEPSKLRMTLIQEMVDNYRNTQLVSIEDAPRNGVKGDSHSILFDLDTLKKFISDIEKGVKQVQPNANPKLAIRMYYAAYPLASKWGEPGYENLRDLLGEEITKQYERKHTLIMIPVIKNKKGVFADFNPFDKNTYQGFPKRLKTGMQLFRVSTDTTEVMGLNHGQLIPPKSIEGEAF